MAIFRLFTLLCISPCPKFSPGKSSYFSDLNPLSCFFFLNFILCNFTILYWFCRISKWICHRYICVLLCNWPAIHSAPWYLFPQELTMKYKCLPSLPEAFQPSSPLNLFSCHVPRWQLETDGFNILAAFQSYWKRENK